MIPEPTHPSFNAVDRSKQYTRADNAELLRSLNELWKTSRLNETAIRDRDKQIATLHAQLEERDELIERQAGYLKTKDLKFWVLRFALGLLIAAQWSAIAFLVHELLGGIK